MASLGRGVPRKIDLLAARAVEGEQQIRVGGIVGELARLELLRGEDDLALHELHGRRDARGADHFGNRANRRLEIGERNEKRDFRLRKRQQAESRAGDDAEGSLGADNEVLERVAGGVLRNLPSKFDNVAAWQYDGERTHVVARDAVLAGAHPTRVSRYVPADRRRLLARVRRIEEPALLDVLRNVHQQHAGLHCKRHVPLVELEDVRHAARVEKDAALERHSAADEPGAAAADSDGDVVSAGISHHRRNFLDGQDLHADVRARERASEFVMAVVLADPAALRDALFAAERLQEREILRPETAVAHFASFFALMRAISSGTIV